MRLLQRSLLLGALWVAIPASGADVVLLKNGERLRGTVLRQASDVVVLRLGDGAEVSISTRDLVQVMREVSPPRSVDPEPTPTEGQNPGFPTERSSGEAGTANSDPSRPAAIGNVSPAAEILPPTGGVPVQPTPEQPKAGAQQADQEAPMNALDERYDYLEEKFGNDPVSFAQAVLGEDPALGLRAVADVARMIGNGRMRGLLLLLQHPDVKVGLACVKVLAGDKDEVVLPVFLQQLPAAPGELQQVYLRRLRRSADREVSRQILGAAGKLDPAAWADAAHVLRAIWYRLDGSTSMNGPNDPVPMLVEALAAAPDPRPAAAMLDFLIRLRRPGLLPVFGQWAESTDVKCRVLAVRGIGLSPEFDATGALLSRYAQETSQEVQVEYARALGARQSLDALAALLELMQNPATAVRTVARETLKVQLGVDHADDLEAWRASIEDTVRRVNRRD